MQPKESEANEGSRTASFEGRGDGYGDNER